MCFYIDLTLHGNNKASKLMKNPSCRIKNSSFLAKNIPFINALPKMPKMDGYEAKKAMLKLELGTNSIYKFMLPMCI